VKISCITLLAFFAVYGNSVKAFEREMAVIEVTATIIKDDVSSRNVPKHSISRQDILTMSPVTVVDLLRNVPGVSVTQQGGKGGLTFVSMRGGEPNFTVVMIDGVKVNDIINSRGGGYDFVGLDPLLIQRIDVYFGGLSPVYGSEALGGVISITTLNEQEEVQTVSLEAGSNDQHAAAFHVATPLGRTAIANVSGAYRDGGDAVEGDSLERNQLIFKLNSMPESSVDWKLSFFHGAGDSSSFPEDSGGDQLAVIRETEQRDFEQNNFGGSASWPVTDKWRVAVSATYAKHDEELNNPGIAAGVIAAVPPVSSDSEYTHSGVNVTNTLALAEKTTLGIGAEWTREDGAFDSIIDFGFPVVANFEIDRDIYAGFAEINHQFSEDLSVTGGVRYDDADGIDETTYRFASRYHLPATQTDFVVQYGEGFKLPSFFALGHPLVGNPALEPEFSKNASFGIEQMLVEDQLKLAATYFYNRFTNLVDFDPMLFTNVNRSKVVAKGGELQLTYQPGDEIQSSVYVTYTDYQADAGVTLRRRPDWTGGISLLWQPNEPYFVSLQANYVDSFFDSSVPTGLIEMDAYTKMDATVGWQVSEDVNFKFIANNLLNSGFEETVGFSNPGREFRVQLNVIL